MRHELAAGRANLHQPWAALAVILNAVEELAPVGATRSSEAVLATHGPEPHHEEVDLIRGIQAIAAERG